MKDSIIEILRNNPSLSYDNVASEINYFCSSSSIQRWMVSHDGYYIYTQRTLPLLSSDQMKKHVKFAKHLLNNYDEKWWYGHVNRANCKLLELLGLEKTHTYVYHKNHVDKVMVVAFTAYAFENNVENSGVRRDFQNTKTGVVKKLNVVE